MKYKYQQLELKMCKMSVGCMRLENPNFRGTDECEYAEEPIQKIKNILGIGEQMKI